MPRQPVRWSGETTGCLVDGHWGRLAICRMLRIAIDAGYEMIDGGALACYENDDVFHEDCDALGVLLDEANRAEEWLNEHVAPEGYMFGWYEGEFFFSSDIDWQSNDDPEDAEAEMCTCGSSTLDECGRTVHHQDCAVIQTT